MFRLWKNPAASTGSVSPRFISVKWYKHYDDSELVDIMLNVDSIVAFWGGTWGLCGEEVSHCVHVTTQASTICIAGTVEELMLKIETLHGVSNAT